MENKAREFAATELGQLLMGKANEVVRFQVEAGAIENTREAKVATYEAALELLIEQVTA